MSAIEKKNPKDLGSIKEGKAGPTSHSSTGQFSASCIFDPEANVILGFRLKCETLEQAEQFTVGAVDETYIPHYCIRMQCFVKKYSPPS